MTRLLPVSVCYCHKKKTMGSLGFLVKTTTAAEKRFICEKTEKAMA